MKWAGGKTRLLPQLLARAPQTFDRYFEPFAGGAALFFALRASQRVWRGAVLGDANADLIACYRAVRDSVESVVRDLEWHQREHGEAHYYRTRDLFNADRTLSRAAAFLYLNKTCFNGLWRVNAKGAFNVPMGAYKNPTICNADALRAASRALQGIELCAGDYRDCVHDAAAGDFVYFDPPYDDTFNAYTSGGAFDQTLLADTARELVARGVHVVLSNSATPLIRELYADFTVEVVRSPRSVNSDGAGRGDVDELIITASQKETVAMPAQLQIAGTEAPDRVPAVEDAIAAWLDAKVEQRRAADVTKLKHASIVALYQEHGIDVHPYTDPKTGKPKRLWLAKEPKAKSSSVPVARVPRGRRRGGPRRDIDVQIAGGDEDTKIEMRRVPRASVEKEIDGFASVRERMEAKQADAAKQADKLPTRGKAKRGK